jgi:DMSO/TMAO reductase YedYZ molybdopterin-dependent catalytic subunit
MKGGMKGFAFLALSLIICGCIGQTEVREQEITPLADFFVIDQGTQPDIDAVEWRLEVSGLIYNPLSLGYEDILSFPSLTEVVHLKCVMVGLEGTGKWKGVSLKYILEEAYVKEGAAYVQFTGADGYTALIALEEAMRDSTILAYEMNDVTLLKEHGFPARLVLPGALGHKWVKWIMKIEVLGVKNLKNQRT